jgi:hypothetical protein
VTLAPHIKQRRRRPWAPFVISVMALFWGPQAQALDLVQPVDCVLGSDCYIQRLMDHDPRPGKVLDFACGTLAGDDHSGTDFALPSIAAMEAGVAVTAAADGQVVATRNSVPDTVATSNSMVALSGIECGNGVRIDHGGGVQSLYCHLKLDSLVVKAGDRVTAGARLADIGMSGKTSYPHLHFTLLRNGENADPFQADPADTKCDGTAAQMWDPALDYTAGGLVSVGFSDRVPTLAEVQRGLPDPPQRRSDLPALVIWVLAFAAQADDRLHLILHGPDGVVVEHGETLAKTQPLAMRAVGKRTPPSGWSAGLYTGTVTLTRGQQTLGVKDVILRLTKD